MNVLIINEYNKKGCYVNENHQTFFDLVTLKYKTKKPENYLTFTVFYGYIDSNTPQSLVAYVKGKKIHIFTTCNTNFEATILYEPKSIKPYTYRFKIKYGELTSLLKERFNMATTRVK